MGKMVNITDEERERRRQNALALKEQGRIGPQFGKLGGRPKNPRAATKVAEKVANDGERLYERLMKIVENGVDANAIKAINALMKIEEQERQLEEKEVINLEQAKRNELLEIVAGGLRELEESGIIPGLLSEWTVEITDAEFETISSSVGSIEEAKQSEGATDR
jgi:hypothetical protein